MRGGTFAQVKPDVSKLEAWAHTSFKGAAIQNSGTTTLALPVGDFFGSLEAILLYVPSENGLVTAEPAARRLRSDISCHSGLQRLQVLNQIILLVVS